MLIKKAIKDEHDLSENDASRIKMLITAMEYLQILRSTHDSIIAAYDLFPKSDLIKEAQVLDTSTVKISITGVIKALRWINNNIAKIHAYAHLSNNFASEGTFSKFGLMRKLDRQGIPRASDA